MTVLTCPKCGEEVSGPDAASVEEVMQRHLNKSGHGAKKSGGKKK